MQHSGLNHSTISVYRNKERNLIGSTFNITSNSSLQECNNNYIHLLCKPLNYFINYLTTLSCMCNSVQHSMYIKSWELWSNSAQHNILTQLVHPGNQHVCFLNCCKSILLQLRNTKYVAYHMNGVSLLRDAQQCIQI